MSEVRKNISVYVRLRPNVDGEGASPPSGPESEIISTQQNKIIVQTPGQARKFEVDKVYPRSASIDQLYADIMEPLVQRVFAGYHGVVMAYGALGTGKAQTLFGTRTDFDGLITRSAEALFNKIDQSASAHNASNLASRFFVTLSAYDVHANNCIDLLNPNTKTGLNLQDHRSFGCFVDGLAELEVTNAHEVKSFLKQAKAVRDALESRVTNNLGKPHCIVDLHLESIDPDNSSVIRVSTLRFATMAGCGGVALKFNNGLQVLNKCIDGLAQEKESWSIPYNTSKLTRLLENGLGGNAFSVFINTIDTREKYLNDIVHTLEVAEKSRKIKTAAKINKNTIQSAIREVREEIKKARGKLNLNQPGSYLHDIDPSQIKLLKQLIAELDRLKNSTWERRRAHSINFLNTRKITLEQEGLLYILQQEIDIPENLLSSSKNMLTSIIQQKLMIEDTENELNEKKNLYKLRLDAFLKKQQENKDNGAEVAPPEKDEKLNKLEKTIQEIEEKLRTHTNDLSAMEEEYRKILTKINVIESKQRKSFLNAKDYANLEKLNRAGEFSEMKKESDNDVDLKNMVDMINTNTETARLNIINNYATLSPLDTANALRDEALNTILALKDVTIENKKLEWQRDHLWGRLIELKFKNEVNMNRYQEHMFFIFRNYRSHFEEQKERMEARYKELLENAVKDALKLAEENNKLKLALEKQQKTI